MLAMASYAVVTYDICPCTQIPDSDRRPGLAARPAHLHVPHTPRTNVHSTNKASFMTRLAADLLHVSMCSRVDVWQSVSHRMESAIGQTNEVPTP